MEKQWRGNNKERQERQGRDGKGKGGEKKRMGEEIMVKQWRGKER